VGQLSLGQVEGRQSQGNPKVMTKMMPKVLPEVLPKLY
jgi:hypothetical protein